MRAVKVPAQVRSDHTLHLRLPDDIDEGPAEVIVLLAEPEDGEPAQTEAGTLDEFLARPRVDHRYIRSQAEIDAYLRAERDSWE